LDPTWTQTTIARPKRCDLPSSSTSPKPRQPVEHCIFCRRADLTNEHIWAKWLRPYLPRMQSFSSLTSTVYPERSDFLRRSRVGDLHNRRLRIVCARCNNGWMNRLQTCAKPFLLPLIKGEATALDVKARETVAAWIAMTVTVAEYFEERITTTVGDRYYLRKARKPSDRWIIRIGHFVRRNWKAHLVHHTFPISSRKHRIQRDQAGSPRPNTQTTAFTVGQIYVFAATCPTDVFEQWRVTADGAGKLAQIWPIKRNVIGWPPTALTDREADTIAGAFFRFAEEVGRTNRMRNP
jgi:hypothetical protein